MPFPLAMSLMVGTISAITIMGNAGEMYAYGTQIWVMDIGMLAGLIAIAKFFIPVMYPLQMVSMYHVSIVVCVTGLSFPLSGFHSSRFLWLLRGFVFSSATVLFFRFSCSLFLFLFLLNPCSCSLFLPSAPFSISLKFSLYIYVDFFISFTLLNIAFFFFLSVAYSCFFLLLSSLRCH